MIRPLIISRQTELEIHRQWSRHFSSLQQSYHHSLFGYQSQLSSTKVIVPTRKPLFMIPRSNHFQLQRHFASTVEMAQSENDESDDDSVTSSSSTEKKKSSKAGKATKKKIQNSKNNSRRKRKLIKPKQRERTPTDEKVLKQQLEELFDEIAPQVLLNKLEVYTTTLEGKHNPKQRQRMANKMSKDADGEKEQEEDPKNWMHAKLLSFLDILPLHARPVQTMESPSVKNKNTLKETAAILKRAREKAAHSEVLSWSKETTSQQQITSKQRQKWHAAKSDRDLSQEAKEFAKVLSTRLPSNKLQSLVRFLDDYVQLAGDEPKRVPVPGDDKDTSADNSDNEAKAKSKSRRRPKRVVGIRILFNNVERKLGGHIHLIAPELSKFFYFDPPDMDSERKSIAYKEPKVIESEKKWKAAKHRFVKKMLSAHRSIHNPTEEDGDTSTVNEEEDEILTDIVEKTLKEPSLKDTTEADKMPVVKGTKNHVHLLFDTVVTDQYREKEVEYAVSSNTTVFIENLPIDITENQVMELYSGCGLIESVEIFNQRPDLDPGALSTAKQKAMAQQRRKSRLTQSKGIGGARWTRPRTPVYAMLSFADEESTQAASQDPLRIFGMIVNGHSVRSIRAREMTRLYIDGIPPLDFTDTGGKNKHRTSMDIEYSLSQILNPDIYVSLDVSSSSHKKSKRAVIGSCEIMFPSFEVAHDSYCKLHDGLDFLKEDEDCSLNWLKTPPDAILYWTRHLGGV